MTHNSILSPISGSDEALVAYVETKMVSGEADEVLIALGCTAQDRIDVANRQRKAMAEAQEVAEAPKADAMLKAQAKAKEAFVAMRQAAANELAKVHEFDVAMALRGKVAPAWAKGALKRFLARFPSGKHGRFHDIVEATLVVIEEAIAQEAEEIAEAERIRAEAAARQKKNRRDRATQQSRGAKGGTGGGKKK